MTALLFITAVIAGGLLGVAAILLFGDHLVRFALHRRWKKRHPGVNPEHDPGRQP